MAGDQRFSISVFAAQSDSRQGHSFDPLVAFSPAIFVYVLVGQHPKSGVSF